MADNVTLFPSRNPHPTKRDTTEGPGHTGNGNPPGGDDVEARVAALEKAIPEIQIRLVKLDSRLDNIEKQMATKADLQEMVASIHKAMNDQTWKFMGAATALAAIAFTAAKMISGS